MAETGNGFDAGSIFVALKAQIADLEKGLTKAKSLLGQFGDKAEETGSQVSNSGQGMAVQFDKTDRQTLKFTERIARFTNRLVSLQFAISSLGQSSKDNIGGMAHVAEAAQASMTAFAASISLLPNKLGLVLGSLSAVAVGVQTLAKSVDDFKRLMDESVLAATEWSERMRNGLLKELVIINRLGNAFGKSELDKFKDRLEATKKEIESLIRFAEVEGPAKIRQLQELRKGVSAGALAPLEKGAKVLGLTPGTSKEIIQQGIDDVIEQTRGMVYEANMKVNELIAGQFQGFGKQIVEKEFEEAREKARQETKDLVMTIDAELAVLADKEQLLLRQGLLTPLEVAEQRARATAAALEELFKRQAELNKLKPGLGNELASEIGTAIGRAKKDRDLRDTMVDVDRMAQNFGGAVGAGLGDAILTEGTSALEALSMVGENLFQNWVRDSMSKLQSGLSSAFTKIVGEAGVGFASMLTGVIGLVGMFLSRGKGSSSKSFDSTRDVVESTQAFRGIVAGDPNVSIAAVGEDLQRALIPTNDILLRILGAVRKNGGSAPPAAGGFAFAGTAPTT